MVVIFLVLVLALALPASATEAEAPPTPAIDTQGVIYGKITTTRGETYQGRIRWDGEESFWGDHFDGTKDEMPFFEQIPREERRRTRTIRVLGIRLGSIEQDVEHSRSTTARFGDVEAIEPQRRGRVVLHMKGGSTVELDGGSNDVGADVTVWDRERGEIEIPWQRLVKVELMPAPKNLEIEGYRLQGKVTSSAGVFAGWIEWDNDERLSIDILDGDDPDGERRKIPMGEIRLLERHSRSSTRVVLKSGEELLLDGTNDVDSGNRGIVVDDPRYGRVEIAWPAFERLELGGDPSCGPSYHAFEPATHLRGTVVARDGAKHSGRLAYDLDESETWEILNGEQGDVEYDIPFSLVRAIEPLGSGSSRVELVSGTTLELEGTADVDESNAGVLVIGEAGAPTYLPWDRVRRIEFTP